ncbi:hypothetical protein CS022_18280 [Veronia nyctiphanis]|uniref:Uncharacterized protein n=1 Tax=Veronia nyctiphanis TaxID=1278244 RepID=A0A4Q0YMF3_9GAMM|nr:hypothetical protein [Veronia nyctiphanis]RXJ72027.1 hypothetical protein CS022_18000 [Veronia nyctiphanis]RXJ72074.1 hypothetical protein CS022_18280 [Veronia nyctiphanis]
MARTRQAFGQAGENGDETLTQRRKAMSRSVPSAPCSTNARQAGNVSPLHHSGSTAMSSLRPFRAEVMDKRLFDLYCKLRALNPSVYEMVTALNVALRPYGWLIHTVEALECFIDAADEWEAENE